MMRARIFFCVAVGLMLAGPVMASETGLSVTTASGGLSLRGAAQVLYDWVQADPGRQAAGVDRFQTRGLHFGGDGVLSETVDYSFTFSLVDGATFQADVYEAWIAIHPLPGLVIRTGSFPPPWTLTMPRPIHDLRFVRYPLIVDPGVNLFTPWRQTGVLAEYRPGKNFRLAVGLWDGLDLPNNYTDDNNMKDTMVTGSFEAFPGVRLSLGHWGGKTDLREITLNPGEHADLPFGLSETNNTAAPIVAGGGVIDHTSTWAAFEIERGSWYFASEVLWHRSHKNGEGLLNAQGCQVSLGYTLDRLRALLRYEQYDPNTDDSGAGRNDEMEWTTLAINYNLTQNLRIMADYIFKVERNVNQRANDEFVLQASLGF